MKRRPPPLAQPALAQAASAPPPRRWPLLLLWAALWLGLCLGVPRERGAGTMGGLLLVPTSQGKVQATVRGFATRYGWPALACEERWVEVQAQRVSEGGRLEPLEATPTLVEEITRRGSLRVTTGNGQSYGSDDPRWQVSLPWLLLDLAAGLLLALCSWRLFARGSRERWLAHEVAWVAFLTVNLAFPLWQALGSPVSPLALASPEVALVGTAALVGAALALFRRALARPRE